MIKHVIGIASGKGGVGKSTVAVNVALALKQSGHTVGLLDADLYGPSLPLLLNIPNDAVVAHDDDKNMQPILAYDMPTMSIGYLVDEKAPAIWRGPIASKAIQQLFYNTVWGALDYLVIDLPPGTGDIHLTLAQKLPMKGVVMVTTPQEIALADVRKAIAMFEKVNIPLLGIIENMTLYHCQHCGHADHLFGEGGGIRLAEAHRSIVLGTLPFESQLNSSHNHNRPILLTAPNSTMSRAYCDLAQKIDSRVSALRVKKFPKIVIE